MTSCDGDGEIDGDALRLGGRWCTTCGGVGIEPKAKNFRTKILRSVPKSSESNQNDIFVHHLHIHHNIPHPTTGDRRLVFLDIIISLPFLLTSIYISIINNGENGFAAAVAALVILAGGVTFRCQNSRGCLSSRSSSTAGLVLRRFPIILLYSTLTHLLSLHRFNTSIIHHTGKEMQRGRIIPPSMHGENTLRPVQKEILRRMYERSNGIRSMSCGTECIL